MASFELLEPRRRHMHGPTAWALHPDVRGDDGNGNGDGDGDLKDAGANVSELRDAREAHATQPSEQRDDWPRVTRLTSLPAVLPLRSGSLWCYVKTRVYFWTSQQPGVYVKKRRCTTTGWARLAVQMRCAHRLI
jgi:hypothetical protein